MMSITTAIPKQEFSIRANGEGDLNGDGISDIALVLTGWENGNGPRIERLAVLAGNQDESYTVISVSDDFCGVRKFYELDIQKGSLFVKGFSGEDSTGSSSITLQFRYNAILNDLELIGREELSKKYESVSYYQVSVNYLTGKMIHSRREGKRYKEVKARVNNSNLFRLQGFNCETYNANEPNLHIGEDFSVKK